MHRIELISTFSSRVPESDLNPTAAETLVHSLSVDMLLLLLATGIHPISSLSMPRIANSCAMVRHTYNRCNCIHLVESELSRGNQRFLVPMDL